MCRTYLFYSKFFKSQPLKNIEIFRRFFEFRICDNVKGKQECLDQHLLELLGGTPSSPQAGDLNTRFYPRHGSVTYQIKARLPQGIIIHMNSIFWRKRNGR